MHSNITLGVFRNSIVQLCPPHPASSLPECYLAGAQHSWHAVAVSQGELDLDVDPPGSLSRDPDRPQPVVLAGAHHVTDLNRSLVNSQLNVIISNSSISIHPQWKQTSQSIKELCVAFFSSSFHPPPPSPVCCSISFEEQSSSSSFQQLIYIQIRRPELTWWWTCTLNGGLTGVCLLVSVMMQFNIQCFSPKLSTVTHYVTFSDVADRPVRLLADGRKIYKASARLV